MKRMRRKRLAIFMLVLGALVAVVALAGDVVVAPDELQVEDLKIHATPGAVSIENTANYEEIAFKTTYSSSPRLAMEIQGGSSSPRVDVKNDLRVEDSLGVWEALAVGDVSTLQDDLYVWGTVYSNGGYDPPYVLYNPETRDQVIDRIKVEVPPAKQAGAALFFNKETKRLETYVASEGKFYDLLGNLVHTLPTVVNPQGDYEVEYFLDKTTGQVQGFPKKIRNRFVVKDGVELDKRTGKFVVKETGQQVSRDEALEWFLPRRGEYRDTQGRLLRTQPLMQELPVYVTEYAFDKSSGQVKTIRKAIEGRYEIKAGYTFDNATGQFVNRETGQSVPKEEAVEFIKASDIAERIRARSAGAPQE